MPVLALRLALLASCWALRTQASVPGAFLGRTQDPQDGNSSGPNRENSTDAAPASSSEAEEHTTSPGVPKANATATATTAKATTAKATTTTSPPETTRTVPFPNCTFALEPPTPYSWDPKCKDPSNGGLAGCMADGIHMECRFCGVPPFGACPDCEFPREAKPMTRYTWDKRCKPADYTNGCFADGIHFECRFCGEGDYDPCPGDVSSSTSTPAAVATSTPAATSAPATTQQADTTGKRKAEDISTSAPATTKVPQEQFSEARPLGFASGLCLVLAAIHLQAAAAAAATR